MRKLILLFIVVLATGYFLLNKYGVIGPAPQVTLNGTSQTDVGDPEPIPLGKKPPLLIAVTSEDRVCDMLVLLKQGELEKVLYQNLSPADRSVVLSLAKESTDLTTLGFHEGAGVLNVRARDCSLYKRRAKITTPVRLDFTPPRVSLTSSNHYINQGGADVLTYEVSGDVAWSGVQIGPYEFKGYPVPGKSPGNGEHFAFFVFSYELPSDTTIEVIARDAAANEAKTRMRPARLITKEFRKRQLSVSDRFIDTKVMDIIDRVPEMTDTGDRVRNYIQVNRELRQSNAEFLIELSEKSEAKFYWDDAFLQMGNTAVESLYADFRDYLYQGEKIDEQVHLGFDLASVRHDTVAAANDGKVLFADYLGIYGNTIIIDHGYGLNSLYAHLSQIDVKAGDTVNKGQSIGRTGSTGLAGGDHLHFSMMIHGVQTNPIEFWDQHWIDDHVHLRLRSDAQDVVGAKHQ